MAQDSITQKEMTEDMEDKMVQKINYLEKKLTKQIKDVEIASQKAEKQKPRRGGGGDNTLESEVGS